MFRGLAASRWHTAALTMRLLDEIVLKPAGGIVGVGFDELRFNGSLKIVPATDLGVRA